MYPCAERVKYGIKEFSTLSFASLVSRFGIITSIDLSRASKASLHLKTQVKSRHFLFILRSNLWTFWSRANDAHITHQDIDDLRKLVKANSTNNATNGSNTIVMISRKTGYAVLFCVYPHGAKL